MDEKNTYELEKVLGSTHVNNFEKYCKDNKDSILSDDKAFTVYFKELFRKRGLKLQDVFARADISEGYGYKLLSGEKRTRQRDVILRICYAGEFSLEETQRALSKYEMPKLYAKIPRDALIMIIFNERPGNIIDVNEVLIANGMEALRPSGVQD